MYRTIAKWTSLCLALALAVPGLAASPRTAEAAPAQTITPNPIPSQVHRTTDRYSVTANGVELGRRRPLRDHDYRKRRDPQNQAGLSRLRLRNVYGFARRRGNRHPREE